MSANIDASLFGAGYAHITTKKILGGNYGFSVLLAGANNRIQGTEIDQNPGAGITDSVVQPISLGWHLKRADAQVQYTLYVPTGRYTDGAANNTGLGMWGQEVMAGVTGYLTEDRKYHAATAVSFNFQSKKEDSETKVGNAMNLEGRHRRRFPERRLDRRAGLLRVVQADRGSRSRACRRSSCAGKNRAFAIGPEVTLTLARKNTVYGFLNVEVLLGDLRAYDHAGRRVFPDARRS